MITFNIGENQENFKAFLSEIGYNDQNKITFWKDLIAEIQKGQGDDWTVPSTSHPYPIRESDFPDDTTLLKLISNLCDLSKEDDEGQIDISKLYYLIREDDSKSFWNESVQELCNRIQELNEEENPTLIHVEENVDLTLQDFEKADAGANYNDISAPPVHPYINIENKNYDKIRNTDQIHKISEYLDKVDFTNDHSEWITLIMPNYGRGTKIEDLNRNFWVIAEAIDGISSWVMEKSPIQEILKKFLNEITQLWENCLYLWMHISLMNQKKSENIISISKPLTSNICECLTHYDNIPKITCRVENNTFEIEEEPIYQIDNTRVLTYQQLKNYNEAYSQSVFGILPIYRINNYRHNYYSGQYYKNFYVLNPNEINNQQRFSYENYQIIEVYDNNKERPIVISPRYEIIMNENKRFSNKIFSTRFNENKYYYAYPFSQTDQVQNDKDIAFLMYGCLKVIPDISFSLNDIEGIDIEKFNLKVYDAAAPIILGEDREIGRFVFKEVDNENKKIKLEYNSIDFEQEKVLELKEKYCFEISESYYQGDVASWRKRIPINWN